MPESPEVAALAADLHASLVGIQLDSFDILEFRSVKTRTRLPETLVGKSLSEVARYGKLLDFRFKDEHLIVSLGRHGWVRYQDPTRAAQATSARSEIPALATASFVAGDTSPGKGAVAGPHTHTTLDSQTIEFADGGTWVSLGFWVVSTPRDVAAVAKLGPDPLDLSFDASMLTAVLAGRRKQIKALLQEQETLAGIGNAYSDEILHAAKISPVAHAAALTPAEIEQLYIAIIETLRSAAQRRSGIPIEELKANKVAGMQVHGRAGQRCPVCGGVIRDFSAASTVAQYCATCQTAGKILPLKK